MKTYSIVIPTLNAQRVLQECLDHIVTQNYPQNEYEIIIADGGSTDKTLEIAKKYKTKIVSNPLKTGEAGKMVGVREASGEYIIFLDSDNILIDKDWLTKMCKPFEDPEIIAAEPIMYSCRPTDHPFTRYFAYLGMGDPINLFLGNYDRICAITNTWTGLHIHTQQKQGYLKVELRKGNMPTIGANGFIIRKKEFDLLHGKDYFFDVDIVNELIEKSGKASCYIAKVETGVVHIFSGTLTTMVRKYRRKVKDYVYYNSMNMRSHAENTKKINPILNMLYPGGTNIVGLLIYLASCVTVLPLIVQAIIGFSRRPDWVWILHPFITEITCYVYTTERIKSFFKKEIHDRSKWSQ